MYWQIPNTWVPRCISLLQFVVLVTFSTWFIFTCPCVLFIFRAASNIFVSTWLPYLFSTGREPLSCACSSFLRLVVATGTLPPSRHFDWHSPEPTLRTPPSQTVMAALSSPPATRINFLNSSGGHNIINQWSLYLITKGYEPLGIRRALNITNIKRSYYPRHVNSRQAFRIK
jgi:hypothetical protein